LYKVLDIFLQVCYYNSLCVALVGFLPTPRFPQTVFENLIPSTFVQENN